MIHGIGIDNDRSGACRARVASENGFREYVSKHEIEYREEKE